jgi:predicted lipoprotein with Yx(FWY)xxD motif
MTRGRRVSLFTSLSLVIVLALAVAACGDGGGANASSATAATSSGSSPTVRVESSALGEILVDAQGRTLYLFTADSGHVSACDGACAAAWPPLLADGNPRVARGANLSLLSTIRQSSGARQLAYNGHPLYLYAGDQKPGDVNGQGVTAFGAPWYTLSPAGNQISSASSVSGSAASSPGGSGY